ncbi:MAG: rhodanese-like domain-containing protein [Planctomycetota bacterium]
MKWLHGTVIEALLVVACACGVGLAWNHFSDKGLSLSRNYFPAVPSVVPTSPGATGQTVSTPGHGHSALDVPSTPTAATTRPATPGTQASTHQPASTEPSAVVSTPPVKADPVPESTSEAAPGLDRTHGLNTMSTADAADYQGMAGFAVFVDARSREHYDEGHIPGAYYLNHYQSQKLIEDIRPDLEAADVIVVYCGGGNCEDSILLAASLISEYGFAHERVYVYLGGYSEWVASGHPVVKGPNRE